MTLKVAVETPMCLLELNIKTFNDIFFIIIDLTLSKLKFALSMLPWSKYRQHSVDLISEFIISWSHLKFYPFFMANGHSDFLSPLKISSSNYVPLYVAIPTLSLAQTS